MIISVEQAKNEIADFKGWSDSKIERKLKAIEQAIRSHTHNNFQDRDCRRTAYIVGGSFYVEALTPFEVGDTVQISESGLNKGLFTVATVYDSYFTVEEEVKDEKDVLVTKIVYPADVVECAFNLLEWELKHRDKVGIQSETLSRHSVTYFNMDGDNSIMGYPKSLMGALKPYMKARF
jgi:hypothetical protein